MWRRISRLFVGRAWKGVRRVLASVAQLEARLGEPVGSLTGEDLARATTVLEDASVIVRSVGRGSWTMDDAPPEAVLVTLRLARRFWDNPEELSYELLGDHATSRRGSDVFLTFDERALVASVAGVSAGVYSVRTPGVWA